MEGELSEIAKLIGGAAVGLLVVGGAYVAGVGRSGNPGATIIKRRREKKRAPWGAALLELLPKTEKNDAHVYEPYTPGDNPATVGDALNVFKQVTGTIGGSTGEIGNRLMADLQRDFGFTREQAAGIAGNLAHESAGFQTLQEIKPMVPGSRGGWGFAQWTGPRRRAFEKWAEEAGLDPRSYEANYGFLKYEMTDTWEKRAVDKVRRTSTPAEAAQVFSSTFLRPGIAHNDSRVNWAEKFYRGIV